MVVVGDTEVVPDVTGVTTPIVLSIEKVSALVVVQESTEESPELIAVGFAESVQVGVGIEDVVNVGVRIAYVHVTPDWLVASGL